FSTIASTWSAHGRSIAPPVFITTTVFFATPATAATISSWSPGNVIGWSAPSVSASLTQTIATSAAAAAARAAGRGSPFGSQWSETQGVSTMGLSLSMIEYVGGHVYDVVSSATSTACAPAVRSTRNVFVTGLSGDEMVAATEPSTEKRVSPTPVSVKR